MKPQPSGGFAWAQAAAGPVLVCEPLARVAPHVFTTRSWRFGSTDSHAAEEGWAEVAAAMNVAPENLIRLHQVHGNAVFVAGPQRPDSLPKADIAVSDCHAAIAVQAADCLPLLIADRRTGAIAAAHAGWRGLAARVPQFAVAGLAREFGSRPEDLIAALGPAIGACCYEVGHDVRDAFVATGADEADLRRWFGDNPRSTAVNPSMPIVTGPARAGHWFMDGWSIARAQLQHAGVPPNHIHVAALCTASHPALFCSYRRDGAPAGRLAAAIRRAPGASSRTLKQSHTAVFNSP
jgi:YfiH family protein